MVIFNQQGWEKQEIEEGIDKDEGMKVIPFWERTPLEIYL